MTTAADPKAVPPKVHKPRKAPSEVGSDAASAPGAGEEVPFAGNPEFAWKALLLVVDWIKQAEIKAGGSLAAAGVLGGLLYNLVKSQSQPGVWLAGLAVVATGLICLTAVFGALVFWPRLRHRDEPKSPLFFHHIARKHSGPTSYVQELSLLTGRAEDLVAEIAEQVYWNSMVAHRKYTWASWAIRALLLALISMAVLAGLVGGPSVS
jgi:hypothetical protein